MEIPKKNGAQLKTAVIGVGYLGNFHAQKHKNNPDVNLVGVCDFSPSQANKIAIELGTKAFNTPKDLVGKIDAVTIATTTTAHFDIAKLFLSAGVHVFVEKPITATLAQAEELVNLAAQKNVKLAVGHIERFNPAVIEFKKHLESPLNFEFIRQGPFKARGSDVSVLHDLMIHDLDLLLWMSQSEILDFEVTGVTLLSKSTDVATAYLKMKNGIEAAISVSRAAPLAQRSIRSICKGQILFANTATMELQKIEKGTEAEPMKITNWTVDKKDALQIETQSFFDCITKNQKPEVTGEDGLKALIWIEKIHKKIELK
ncbi:MAG: Gfo/Idh/MocA family oxidoreductase [Bdellovibrionota bacterium]